MSNYNSSVHRIVHNLAYVMANIIKLKQELDVVKDPELIIEYKQELQELIEDLDLVSDNCLYVIEVYINECKELGEPVNLDYYRIYKSLLNSKRGIYD